MSEDCSKIKIAFITSVYQEDCFTSGGVKLNYILLKFFNETGNFIIDVYAEKYNENVKIPHNIYNYNDFNDNVVKNYQYILSEKGIFNSDVTYLHDHTNKFRHKFMYKKWFYFIYKIISRKQYLNRKMIDGKIQNHLKYTKKIIVSSKVLKEDYVRNYNIEPSKIYILPPPVEYKEYKTSIKNQKIFTFGLSATGFERKGGYYVLKSVAKLKKKYLNFKVKIICKKQNLFLKFLILYYGINRYVDFVPIQKDMSDFYDSIDCLLMPSILEPFGMVATEAMMNSKPAIVSKISGASYIINDGVNGFITNNKNLDEKMQQVLDMTNEEYINMCKNAYNSVVGFTCENFAKKYMEILEK